MGKPRKNQLGPLKSNSEKPIGPATALNSSSGGFKFQEQLLSPVLVNLMTAFIIFLAVALLRDQIYPLVLPHPKIPDFPIYCSSEAYLNDAGEQVGEIYIANLKNKSFSEMDLRSFITEQLPENAKAPDHLIRVFWVRDVGEMHLEEDVAFNRGKGQLAIKNPSGGGKEASIDVLDINRNALLRVIVHTNYVRPITRSDPALPFRLETPRKD